MKSINILSMLRAVFSFLMLVTVMASGLQAETVTQMSGWSSTRNSISVSHLYDRFDTSLGTLTAVNLNYVIDYSTMGTPNYGYIEPTLFFPDTVSQYKDHYIPGENFADPELIAFLNGNDYTVVLGKLRGGSLWDSDYVMAYLRFNGGTIDDIRMEGRAYLTYTYTPAVPVPSAMYFMGSALSALFFCRKRSTACA